MRLIARAESGPRMVGKGTVKTRQTDHAFSDRDHPMEVYEQGNGRLIFVGKRGRVHVFDGESHLTSFRMSRRARHEKVKQGKWRRIH